MAGGQGDWFRMQEWLRGEWDQQYTRLNLSSAAQLLSDSPTS